MIERRVGPVVGIKSMVVIEEAEKMMLAMSFRAPSFHSKDIRRVRPSVSATPSNSSTRKGRVRRSIRHIVHRCHLYLHAVPWTPMTAQIMIRGWTPTRTVRNWISIANPSNIFPMLVGQIPDVSRCLHSLLSSSYLA